MLLIVLAVLLTIARPVFAQTNVLTYHNDNARTGQNLQETILTLSSVTPNAFGKLFSLPVDGAVYAQPLYLSGLALPGQGTHNVVFVATEHDSVYAFDADDPTRTAPLWRSSLIPAGGSSAPSDFIHTGDIMPEIGITGTPVIDPASGTLYVVAITLEAGQVVQRLHALDVHTGAEQPGSPVTIQASIAGVGLGNDGQGHVPFNPQIQNQRAALLLLNGIVYIAWASHGDNGPFHGWLIGYDAATLQQKYVFNTTPDAIADPNGPIGAGGGIWQAGGGPSADADGSIYVTTANGQFDAFIGGTAYSDSFLKLAPLGATLDVLDYFTPSNQAGLDHGDGDLGSGSVLLLPDQNSATPRLLTSVGKEGALYLINRDTGSMGLYNTLIDNVVQEFRIGNGVWGTAAYFNQTLYFGPTNQRLQAFAIQSTPGLPTQIFPLPNSQSQTAYSYPGATPAISANGSQNGILWTIEGAGTGTAVLHAYDAANLASELYNSTLIPNRDDVGGYVKFTTPTVANGKVYVGANGCVAVFGLGQAIAPPTIQPDSGTFYPSVTVTISDITPGGEAHYTTDGSAPSLASPLYTGPFTLSSSGILRARNFKTGAIPSTIAQASFGIDAGTGRGDGLLGTYYNSNNLTGTSASEIDPTINFAWNGAPPAPGITAYPWSAVWTGKLQPRYTADTTLTVLHGGGAALWLDGQLLFDRGNAGPEVTSVTLHLVGGQLYDIRLFYQQFGGLQQLGLYWSDATRPQELIPQSQLYSGATLIVPAPVITPQSGAFYPTAVVTMTDALAGAEIRYTTDGSPPTPASPLYVGPFTIAATTTVTAKAFRENYTESPAVSATYVSNPALAHPVYAIDSGSDQDVPPFVKDAYFVGGAGHTRFGQVDTSLVTNPAPELVYQAERIGNFSYVLPNLSPGGAYILRLHFAENVLTAAGQRVFNVTINGQPVLANFDIFAAAGGQYIAITRQFNAIADATGAITVQFASVVGQAKVSGIEVLDTPPARPTNLTAQAGDARVSLNWTASSGAETYTVKRGLTSGGPYTVVVANLSAANYADTSVVNGVAYYYVVTANNNDGESPNSNEASATPLPLPAAPVGLTAVAGDAKVYLAWTGNVGYATTFAVQRSLTSGGPYTSLVTGLTNTLYTDRSAVNGVTYYYRILAVNPAGSAGGNEASATPLSGADGVGLLGEYYSPPDNSPPFTNLIFTRTDPVMDFKLGVNGWPGAGVRPNYFSARWLGWLKAPATGSFVFTAISDDGERVILNDNPVINNFTAHPPAADSSAPMQLTAGQLYEIQIEYFQGGGDASFQLLWAYPGQPMQIIPQAFLYSASLPDMPGELIAQGADRQVLLSWSGVSNADSYTVKRSLTSGGPYAIVASGVTDTFYTDTEVTNNQPYYYVVSAVSVAGESANSNEASATPYLRDGGVHINCGGAALAAFMADAFFSGPSIPYATTNVIDTADVLYAAPAGVYQSQRVGDMTYAVPNLTPNSIYKVRLHFAELVGLREGERQFNVSINGEPVLLAFDILTETRMPNRAVVETFLARTDSSGTITIAFVSLTGRAVCNGIEILPAPGTLCGTLDLTGISPNAPPQNVTFEFRPDDGSDSFQVVTYVNPDGAFCVTDLPPAAYAVWVKSDKYLARVTPFDLASQSSILDAQIALLPGDANGDNRVNIGDLGLVVNAYLTSNGDADYNFSADLDSNGIVDIGDFGLLIDYYGEIGDP